MNINNAAKTGKSHLIAVLFRILSELIVIASKPLPLVRAAFTGVVAFGINGQTMYNLLKLSVQRPFKDLPPISLMPLQQKFRNIHYLVLDKKLIIRHVHLGWIDY